MKNKRKAKGDVLGFIETTLDHSLNPEPTVLIDKHCIRDPSTGIPLHHFKQPYPQTKPPITPYQEPTDKYAELQAAYQKHRNQIEQTRSEKQEFMIFVQLLNIEALPQPHNARFTPLSQDLRHFNETLGVLQPQDNKTP